MKKVLGLMLLSFVVISMILGVFYYRNVETGGEAYIKSSGYWGILVFSAFVEFIPQYVSPHLGLVTGTLLGLNPALVFVLVLIGSFIGSALGFELGSIGAPFVGKIMGSKKYKKFIGLINAKGKWAVLVAALSPIPYVPMIIGSLHMSRRNFFLYGLLPRSLGFLTIYLVLEFYL